MFISTQEKSSLFRKIESLEQSFNDICKSFDHIQEKLRIKIIPDLEKQNLRKQKGLPTGKSITPKEIGETKCCKYHGPASLDWPLPTIIGEQHESFIC